MRCVLGIDAGGTKTVGLLADIEGKILRDTRAGGANLRLHGELGVEKVLYQVLDALEAVGGPFPVAAACLGMAGVDRPEEQETIHAVLRRLGLRQRVRVVNDAYVSLIAGAPAGVGVVIISGTGSIAYGVDGSGDVARAGGWGPLLGDEGSAYWLGHAAVRQGVRAADGRGPATSLHDRIRERLGVGDIPGLVSWFHDQEHTRERVARLASVVEEAALDGDSAASNLLNQAAEHLAQAARAVARQLHFEENFPVVLSGGAFRACPSLAGRLEAGLDLPRAQVVRLEVEPATGAVRLALRDLAENGAGMGELPG